MCFVGGYNSQGNTFDDCMLGVFINGGVDHVVTDNRFVNVDHAMYMGGDGSCYNPLELCYETTKNYTNLPAWRARYGNLMNVNNYATAAEWEHETCAIERNTIANNTVRADLVDFHKLSKVYVA